MCKYKSRSEPSERDQWKEWFHNKYVFIILTSNNEKGEGDCCLAVRNQLIPKQTFPFYLKTYNNLLLLNWHIMLFYVFSASDFIFKYYLSIVNCSIWLSNSNEYSKTIFISTPIACKTFNICSYISLIPVPYTLQTINQIWSV